MVYKRVLIYGYGDSGKSVEKVLQARGVDYSIYVDKSSRGGIENSKCITKINKKILLEYDLVVISPGVSIYSKYVRMAKKLGVEVVGEMEYAYRHIDTPIVAVTGTNGKTTTVSMLQDVLANKHKVKAMGNIGEPMSEYIGYSDKLDYIVAEVSSFQLESIDTFMPYISVILNIAPDHIDRHGSMAKYIEAKLNICKNNTKSSMTIVNIDDENISRYYSHIKGKVYTMSMSDK